MRQCIGYASVEIKAGEHVHTHNVEFRNTQIEYEFSTDNDPGKFIVNDAVDSFMGFRRANGNVGTRNYIAIVTSELIVRLPQQGELPMLLAQVN